MENDVRSRKKRKSGEIGECPSKRSRGKDDTFHFTEEVSIWNYFYLVQLKNLLYI